MPDTNMILDRITARHTLPPAADRKLIRELAGESQAACAVALGVSRQAFAHWEAGRRQPRGEMLVAYLRFLEDIAAASVPPLLD